MSNEPDRTPYVTLSPKGLRLHVPHGDGIASVDLTAENASKLCRAIAEKLTTLKGQGALVELIGWLMK